MKDAVIGPGLFSPKVLCDHDRVAVYRSMRHWHEALPDGVLANPGDHSWRVRGVSGADDVRMESHHRVRCLMPDGTTDLLFLPKTPAVFENVTVRDLSGNGRHMRGIGYSPPSAHFDAREDWSRSAVEPSEPMHLPPRVCK